MQDFDKLGVFYLGRPFDINIKAPLEGALLYDSRDLVTHGVCIGMTGSGKTGLCICLLEEAALDSIPSIIIDPKGDITNLLLTFPDLRGEDFAPWINEEDALKKGLSPQNYAVQQAELWKNGLAKWGQDGDRIKRLRESADFVIYTPGSSAGLPVSILRSFAAPPREIAEDSELLQERISTTVTSLLGLLGIQADPIRSREHILLSTILANAWKRGEDLTLAELIQQIQNPPVTRIGVLQLESFYPSKERFELAIQLNNLLAAPGFELWLDGEALDINRFLYTRNMKPQVSIFYIAHLSDAERMFFVSLLFNQIVGWMRQQSGTTSLRAILYMDEVFGFLPPVVNPPSKTPLLTLLKTARAFGLGIVLTTQNPVDLDYKALSNTGTWLIGRLQTERDKMRVLEALEGVAASTRKQFDRQSADRTLSALGNRIFLMHNVHEDAPVVFETRWAMSYLRGPLTRNQIKMLMDSVKAARATFTKEQPAAAPSIATASVSSAAAGAQRPVLPPEIPQYAIPQVSSKPDASLIYVPMILGAAEIHYADVKVKVDFTRDAAFLASITSDPVPVNWDDAHEVSLKDLKSVFPEKAIYAELPSAASRAKNYELWKKDFLSWLQRTQKLDLLRSPSINAVSRPGENENDFRIRLQQSAREQRDQLAEKLRQKYAANFARLDERIRRAQKAVAQQAAQETERKYSTAVSLGATLLGSFLGRKALGGAARTARDAGRTWKESQDKASAEAELRAREQERADLDAQFQSELHELEAKINPLTEKLEKISIIPARAGISVKLTALVWAPRRQKAQGTETPTWQ